MYEFMVLTRKYDELLIRLFKKNKIPGFIHSGQGQEAIPVGPASILRRTISFSSTTGFGHWLMKGLDPERLAAEMCASCPHGLVKDNFLPRFEGQDKKRDRKAPGCP